MEDRKMDEIITRTASALEKNNFAVLTAENKAEAKALCLSLITENASVSTGGSVTIDELGLLDDLRSGKYKLYDRFAVNDRNYVNQVFHDSFSSSFYISSANAVTENGEIYNVDGTGNRVSAHIYGPEKVIMIVGKNKLVKDLDAAVLRVKEIAAPKNCKRLNRNTYCAKVGHCVSVDCKKGTDMTAGCDSDCRICRDYVVLGPQSVKGRITVILVNEALGY